MNTSPFVKAIGAVIALVGLYFMYQSISFYVESCDRSDWQAGIARITDVRERYKSSGVGRGGKLVHDVFYEYTVDGEVLSGVIYGTADYSKKVGGTFEIKYDPQSPGDSTSVLEPSVSGLLTGILGSCLFIFSALAMTGIIRIGIFKRSP